jgi:RHS repeat-associated protein
VDETTEVVSYHEFDPYGNPVQNGGSPYGYTGEWREDEVGLLYLRARWYAPETGTFLSVDPVESEPPYLYVRGNPANLTDASGLQSPNPRLNACSVCDNFEANGYTEGIGRITSFLVFMQTEGTEVVYDFATMQRSNFSFDTRWLSYIDNGNMIEPGWGLVDGAFEEVGTIYFSTLHNFDSRKDIVAEYSGAFRGFSVGKAFPIIDFGGGYTRVWSTEVTGDGFFGVGGLGISILPISVSLFDIYYRPEGIVIEYSSGLPWKRSVRRSDMHRMQADIARKEYSNYYPPNFPSGTNYHSMFPWRYWANLDLAQTWFNHQTYFEDFFEQCRPGLRGIQRYTISGELQDDPSSSGETFFTN